MAGLFGKVVGSGLPRLVSSIHEMRDASPRLVNTDGDPLCLIKATGHVPEPKLSRDVSSGARRRDAGPEACS